MAVDLRERVRDVPDWPEQGIVFRDITLAVQLVPVVAPRREEAEIL